MVFAPLVFFLVFGHRHHIDAGEPGVQIDVGAAFGAERPQHGIGGLAADRTFVRGRFRGLGAVHECNMGNVEGGASAKFGTEGRLWSARPRDPATLASRASAGLESAEARSAKAESGDPA